MRLHVGSQLSCEVICLSIGSCWDHLGTQRWKEGPITEKVVDCGVRGPYVAQESSLSLRFPFCEREHCWCLGELSFL